MIKNIRHTGFVVSDLEKSIKFYHKLGFKVLQRGNLRPDIFSILYDLTKENIELEYCKLVCDKSILELYYFPNPLQGGFYWTYIRNMDYVQKQVFNHISLTVTDIKKTWKFFKSKKLVRSRAIVEIDKHKLFFGYDLDGNTLELVEPLRG